MTKLNDRQKFAASLPWVTKLTKPKDHCEGIKWGTVALKDLYAHGVKDSIPARGIQDRSRCKKKGWWKFKALRLRGAWDHEAKSGIYCWSHLIQQTYTNNKESDRLNKAWDKYKLGEES